MIIGKHRGALSLAVGAAGLLVACQGASFSELSRSSGRGRPARHAEHGIHVEDGHGPATKVALATGDAPRIVFPQEEADFGQVAQGEKVSHVFKVRNEGKGVLHIKRVRGS